MFKLINNFKNLVICLTVGIFTGCGKVAYDLSSPKAVATPAAVPSKLFSIATDTLLNILGNSLLELTMAVIAIVLYLRYQAFKRQQRQFRQPPDVRHYVDIKTSEGSWHFNEEEKK